MHLSIIIVSWNTRNLLADCLASIYTNPPDGEFEVIVVDNSSGDGSAEMVRQRFPQVYVISNTENVGFARANNQGMRRSAGDLVLLLNSDTIVQASALQNMISFMDAHTRAGIAGAWLYNGDGSEQPCFGPLPSLGSEIVAAWGLDSRPPFSWRLRPHRMAAAKPIRTGRVLGAAMLIRRSALEQVGLLDEGYFMYSEEIDLARRVQQVGWETYALPSAHVIHLGQKSSCQAAARMKAQLFRSKVLYFRKHHGRVAAGVLTLAVRLGLLARCARYRLLGPASQYTTWTDARRAFAQLSRL